MNCLIPAKGQSLRVPKKNTKLFLGTPIISRVIKTALKSLSFSNIDIFTNDPIVKGVVYNEKNMSVNVVHESNFLSEKRTLSDVVLDYLSIKKIEKGKLAILLPTSVFSDIESIRECVLKCDEPCTTLLVNEIDKKALNCYVGNIRFCDRYKNVISQHIPTPLVDSGQFYIIDVVQFLKEGCILGHKINPITLKQPSIDIDTQEDWEEAEKLFSRQF